MRIPVDQRSCSACHKLRVLHNIEEESDSTTDRDKDRDVHHRVSHLLDIDNATFVDRPQSNNHCDSLTLRQEGNNGDYFARRCLSSFDSFQDPALISVLQTY
jgi:hypothetical protein